MARLRIWLIAPAVVAALSISGCVFMRSSSISDSAGKGTAISADASDLGYVWLVGPGDVTRMAADQLISQCTSGNVTNVQTELTVRDFLLIVQRYEASASGVCL